METNNRSITKVKIGSLISRALIKKLGALPSSSKFADQFNLRARGTTTITRETARKWLAGLVVPEIDKLTILIKWLDIEPAEIFKMDEDLTNKNSRVKLVFGNQNISSEHAIIKQHINDCFDQINDDSKKTLFFVALMIKQLEMPNSTSDDLNPLNQVQSELSNFYKKILDLSQYDIKL
jgi:hypothetical protein